MPELKIFSGNANLKLAEDIAANLNNPLGYIEVGKFSDGEVKIKINESVRGKDIFIIQPTCPPVNDNLMELLVMIDAFKRASAYRITPVITYYGYARQEKKLNPREPITAKLVADLLTTAGANRILAVDLHTQSIQGFFNQPVDNIPAGPILADSLLKRDLKGENVVVVSPDVGGARAANILANRLNSGIAIIVKRRPEPNVAETMEVIGEVKDKIVIIFDDLIDTGSTLVSGSETLAKKGAREIYACTTHPVFSGNALEKLRNSPIKEIIITDTIPLRETDDKIVVCSMARVLAEAIIRINRESSVSTLYKEFWR